MKKRLLCVLLTAAMAVTLAAGCGKSGSDSKKNVKETTSASSGAEDTLIFAQGADPRSLDPAFADDGESTKINTNI
ncbi:hypothetical protein [Alistipes shahii]|uniref:hypothetical protein n=1 Tax=Alistipes shahii TaxID=328814 RepID=UPI00241E6AEC|nr:hypothetical protein [Alistipes shahii]